MDCECRNNRECQGDCSRSGNQERQGNREQEQRINRECDLPSNRRELLTYIDEVSFGAYEAVLYLDTHPDCMEAMEYFQTNNQKRNRALREYARLYGPLNLSQVKEEGCSSWEWMHQPWPWEGGNC